MKPLTRLGTLAAAVAAAGTIAAALAPSTAFADTSTSTKLVPGGKTCVSQYAAYQVRGDGTATWNGAFFTIEYLGQVKANSPSAKALGYSQELSTATGTFPGAGYYSVCAYNFQSTNTNVTVRIRTDAEIF
jgi:hypothetical protein